MLKELLETQGWAQEYPAVLLVWQFDKLSPGDFKQMLEDHRKVVDGREVPNRSYSLGSV